MSKYNAMPTFQIASDLHIEYKNNDVVDPWNYIEPVADILILAGDIGSFYKINQLRAFLEPVCAKFRMVLYVPGNQEFYTVDEHKPKRMYQLLNSLYEIENSIENLVVLNQSSIVIDDTVICGCTLWSQPEIKLPRYLVRIAGFTTEEYEKSHKSDLAYVEKMIEYCQVNKLKLVVVTHYCPTYAILEAYKARDRFISLYTTNLDRLLWKNKVHTWICGHIHQNFDIYMPNGTRVVGNQRGKPKDGITDYKLDFKVDVN